MDLLRICSVSGTELTDAGLLSSLGDRRDGCERLAESQQWELKVIRDRGRREGDLMEGAEFVLSPEGQWLVSRNSRGDRGEGRHQTGQCRGLFGNYLGMCSTGFSLKTTGPFKRTRISLMSSSPSWFMVTRYGGLRCTPLRLINHLTELFMCRKSPD